MTVWLDVCIPAKRRGEERRGASCRPLPRWDTMFRAQFAGHRSNLACAVCLRNYTMLSRLQWGWHEDDILPLLALSTCSSSSGNLSMASWPSSHLAARKCSSVVSWLIDFVSLSYKTEKKEGCSAKFPICSTADGDVTDFSRAGLHFNANGTLWK